MFQKARIKLTCWYVLTIMMVSGIFSGSIYRMQTLNIDRFEQQQRARITQQLMRQRFFELNDKMSRDVILDIELITEAKKRLFLSILEVNGIILFFSAVFAYMLAGKTLKPIQNMVSIQNQFITDASHELRVPLTSLKSAFEVHLRNKKGTKQEADEIISESITEVNKLSELAESLLYLTSQQKQVHKNNVTVSLQDIIKKSLEKIKPLAKQKNITLEDHLIKAKIVGDANSLQNLFVILLDNAVKYTNKKGKVIITVHSRSKQVFVDIADNGVGIDQKDIPYIFDRFYRADCARCKTEQGGYGLGLSIAKQIVENHHGTITVKSIVDKGSIFMVALPLS